MKSNFCLRPPWSAIRPGLVPSHPRRSCSLLSPQLYFASLQLRQYSEKVRDHFHNPRNVGSFPQDEKNIGTAIVGKATCGDVIKVQVKIEDGVILDAMFKTFGCGSAIASSSYATELIKGKTCDEAMKVKNTDISHELSLPPVKLHCSLLAEDAVKAAIADYQAKKLADQQPEEAKF